MPTTSLFSRASSKSLNSAGEASVDAHRHKLVHNLAWAFLHCGRSFIMVYELSQWCGLSLPLYPLCNCLKENPYNTNAMHCPILIDFTLHGASAWIDCEGCRTHLVGGQVKCGVEVAGKSVASITAVFRLESFAKGLSSCSCCQWGFPIEAFRRSWGDRFGKARVFIDGHEVMVKRYSFLQQLTFSHDAYHLNVDNTALGPLHGCSIHIRVAAQMGLHLAVRLLLPCPDNKEVEC